MKFIHSAVRVSAEEEAKAFYEGLLCLNLVVEYKGERNLMRKLFGVDKEFLIKLYDVGGVFLEVFVGDGGEKVPSVSHICFQVKDRENLKKRAEKMGFKVVKIKRAGKSDLLFIYDRDGNGFEIKEE